MKYTYEEIINFDNTVTIVATSEDGLVLFIPTDPANSDYQRYLRWVEDPEADESGTL